jgi:hypothetical protein
LSTFDASNERVIVLKSASHHIDGAKFVGDFDGDGVEDIAFTAIPKGNRRMNRRRSFTETEAELGAVQAQIGVCPMNVDILLVIDANQPTYVQQAKTLVVQLQSKVSNNGVRIGAVVVRDETVSVGFNLDTVGQNDDSATAALAVLSAIESTVEGTGCFSNPCFEAKNNPTESLDAMVLQMVRVELLKEAVGFRGFTKPVALVSFFGGHAAPSSDLLSELAHPTYGAIARTVFASAQDAATDSLSATIAGSAGDVRLAGSAPATLAFASSLYVDTSDDCDVPSSEIELIIDARRLRRQGFEFAGSGSGSGSGVSGGGGEFTVRTTTVPVVTTSTILLTTTMNDDDSTVRPNVTSVMTATTLPDTLSGSGSESGSGDDDDDETTTTTPVPTTTTIIVPITATTIIVSTPTPATTATTATATTGTVTPLTYTMTPTTTEETITDATVEEESTNTMVPINMLDS